MSTFSWTPYLGDTLWYDNLTHNRLNLAWYPNDEFSVYIEMRNRIFVGSSVNNISNYGELIQIVEKMEQDGEIYPWTIGKGYRYFRTY